MYSIAILSTLPGKEKERKRRKSNPFTLGTKDIETKEGKRTQFINNIIFHPLKKINLLAKTLLECQDMSPFNQTLSLPTLTNIDVLG